MTKKNLLIFLSAISGGILLTFSLVFCSQVQKEDDKLPIQYQIRYFSEKAIYELFGTDYSIPKITAPSELPRYSGKADIPDNDSFLTSLSNENLSTIFNHSGGMASVNTRTNKSTGTANYAYVIKDNKNISSGGTGGVSALIGMSKGSTSSFSAEASFSASISLQNNINLSSNDIGTQAADATADPGRALVELDAIPIPSGLYLLLIASLVYAFRIFFHIKG